MRVMTFNVLCGGRGKRYWTNRKQLVVDTIKKYDPDIFGLQEAHNRWMNYICKQLPDYGYVGVGRDNGKRMGEFSPVFYRKDRFTVQATGNFWLSETPEKPSKGWDAACTRICSYAVLKENATGKEFVYLNTHLDHIGQVAMCEGAKLIAQRSKEFKGLPAILTGDFNVNPEHAAYKTVLDCGFGDTRTLSGKDMGVKTYHAFEDGNKDIWEVIDFIFVRGDVKVNDYKVITDKIDGKLPSDHYPVIADIEL